MKATVKDVAREAGVGVMTASRALNGGRPVSDRLRQRVQVAADRLNYRPSLVARGLRNRQSTLVSLAIIELHNPFFGSLAEALTRALRQIGKEGVLSQHASEIFELHHSYAACGAILAYAFSPEEVNRLHTRHPVVTIGALDVDEQHAPDVSVDFVPAYTRLAQRILAAGRSKVAFYVGRYPGSAGRNGKFETVAGELARRRLAPVGSGVEGIARLADLGARLAESPGCLDAVFCQNDPMAAEVLAMAGRLGLRVPDDLLVVGCDGTIPLPGVWTVAVDFDALAQAAVGQFSRLLEGIDTPKRTTVAAVAVGADELTIQEGL